MKKKTIGINKNWNGNEEKANNKKTEKKSSNKKEGHNNNYEDQEPKCLHIMRNQMCIPYLGELYLLFEWSRMFSIRAAEAHFLFSAASIIH